MEPWSPAGAGVDCGGQHQPHAPVLAGYQEAGSRGRGLAAATSTAQLPASRALPLLDIVYKRGRSARGLLCWASFTQQNVVKAGPL